MNLIPINANKITIYTTLSNYLINKHKGKRAYLYSLLYRRKLDHLLCDIKYQKEYFETKSNFFNKPTMFCNPKKKRLLFD